tara:strand:- start:264 stop:1100 length:837 start_codon:yes stop_codon:yes gene_type:complete
MNKILSENIGWINGQWKDIDKITIPVTDRGASLSDGIFETLLILEGRPIFLKEHIDRWTKSAKYLGMESPPDTKNISTLLKEGLNISSLKSRNFSVRLNWTRGHQIKRGIEINILKKHQNYNFWLEMRSYEPCFSEISALICKNEKRNPHSQVNNVKTFAYSQLINARREANNKGFNDSIILNIYDNVCCGSTSNLLVLYKDKWITPPIESGCLPGIMRQKGIDTGQIIVDEIKSLDQSEIKIMLINSLSCRPVKKLDSKQLKTYSYPKEFFNSIINQ